MKIIIFFVLVGLSFAADGGDGGEELNCDKPIEPRSNQECLIYALEHTSDFAKNLKEVFCGYSEDDDENNENIKAATQQVALALTCAGCTGDDLLGDGKTLEELLKHLGEADYPIGLLVKQLLKALGIDKPTADLICGLAGDALASECLENILKKNTPELLKDLNELVCTGTDKLTTERIIELMTHIGCFGDQALGNENKALEKLLGDVGEDLRPALEDVIRLLRELLGKDGTLKGELLCDVTDALLGKNPLLGGGGGGGVGGAVGGVAGGLG